MRVAISTCRLASPIFILRAARVASVPASSRAAGHARRGWRATLDCRLEMADFGFIRGSGVQRGGTMSNDGLRTRVVSRGLLGRNGAGPKLVWPTEGRRKNAKWRRNDEVRMRSHGNGERRVSKCGGAEATPHRNEWPLPDDPHPASGRPLPLPRARDCGPVPGRGGELA